MLSLGPFGEQIARQFLEERGYQFIEANYKTRVGELDLIMRQAEQVVFVEVKTRSAHNRSTSNKGLPSRKIDRLEAVIGEYLVEHQEIDDWRIDLVAVTIVKDGLAKVSIIPI